MRWPVLFLSLLLLGATDALADSQWREGQTPLRALPVALQQAGAAALLTLSDGSTWRVTWEDVAGSPVLAPVKPPAPDAAPGLIPHGRVALGDGAVRKAWLADATDRYPHAILGDDLEATTLVVESAAGEILKATAPGQSVFEDLEPRLWDLDGDGDPEVWVMRADYDSGARLEGYTIQAGRLHRQYATPPIGRGFRWLNPVGVADFTGDGILELALVITPHIGGILTLYRIQGEQLVPVLAVEGYSNHAIGSRELGLSWIGDMDGDGIADILLPHQGRQSLIGLSLKNAQAREISATSYFGLLQTSLVPATNANGGRVILFADDTPSLRWLNLPAVQ